MKKILITLFLFLLSSPSFALEKIEYKNLKDGAKIAIEGDNWTAKINKNNKDYFVKKIPEGLSKYSEFYSPEGVFLFSTGTQYEFVHKGSLFGYSNSDLKFYEFNMFNGVLRQRELNEDEVQELFSKYEIVKISDFRTSTNSLKIKKKRRNLKIILLNDTDRYFNNYAFSTNNSKYEEYELKGVLNILKKGMIQFSCFGDNTKNKPWYVLLIR